MKLKSFSIGPWLDVAFGDQPWSSSRTDRFLSVYTHPTISRRQKLANKLWNAVGRCLSIDETAEALGITNTLTIDNWLIEGYVPGRTTDRHGCTRFTKRWVQQVQEHDDFIEAMNATGKINLSYHPSPPNLSIRFGRWNSWSWALNVDYRRRRQDKKLREEILKEHARNRH